MLKRRNQDKSKLVYKLMPETIQQQQQRMNFETKFELGLKEKNCQLAFQKFQS